MKYLALAGILALAVGGQIGCVTANSVTDGDRQVEDQAVKALDAALEKVETARAQLERGTEAWTMLGVALMALEDVQLGAAHLQTVHGPPKEPKPYTPENMAAAIAQSKQEHAGTPWGQIALGVGGVAAGIAGTMLGMPWLSSIFPALAGTWKLAADTGVQIITSLRKEAEAGPLTPKKLLEVAKEYGASAPAGVGDLLKKTATAFEEKLGYKPAVKLHEEAHAAAATATPELAPTPSPTPAPVT
jgi:hypothetical protein